MLHSYLQQLQMLLRDSRQLAFNMEDLIRFVNTARGQVAGEGECIRVIGTISTVAAQRAYNFSGINLGVVVTTGAQGVIHIRRINYDIASGQQWIPSRAWEYFDVYYLNTPVPASGVPALWSQYGQGSAGTSTGSGASGSFYIDPLPDDIYALNCDCVCYPQALADDATVEALPYLWTDAVPYFAAYLAYMTAQIPNSMDMAEKMMKSYKDFMMRARQAANPSVVRGSYPQAVDPTQLNRLGLQPKAASG